MSQSFVALLLLGCLAVTSAVDYCGIKSCNDRPHTACAYSSDGPGSQCTGYQGSGLTDSEKQSIVASHNKYRQQVASGAEKRGAPGPQPPAKSMPNLVWDDELSLIAQRWADQCTWGHDKCRDVERFSVGQNIAVMGTTASVSTIKVDSMVDMWYNEVKDFDKNSVSSFKSRSDKMIGHYTQLVWAKTTKIGCGASKYKDGKFNKFYLVCNYGPAGNWIGEPVYETR